MRDLQHLLNDKPLGEMLVSYVMAILLGLMLLSMLLSGYVSFLKMMQLEQAIGQIKIAAMEVMNIINREVKSAGYIGCQKLSKTVQVKPYHEYSITIDDQLMLKNNTITSKHASTNFSRLLRQDSTFRQLYMTEGIQIKKKDIAIIADCQHAELFQVNSIRHTSYGWIMSTEEDLQYHYHDEAEIAEFEVNQIYIARPHREKQTIISSSLYVKNKVAPAKSRVLGVEQLIINGVYQHGELIGITYQFQLKAGELARKWNGYAFMSI